MSFGIPSDYYIWMNISQFCDIDTRLRMRMTCKDFRKFIDVKFAYPGRKKIKLSDIIKMQAQAILEYGSYNGSFILINKVRKYVLEASNSQRSNTDNFRPELGIQYAILGHQQYVLQHLLQFYHLNDKQLGRFAPRICSEYIPEFNVIANTRNSDALEIELGIVVQKIIDIYMKYGLTYDNLDFVRRKIRYHIRKDYGIHLNN